MGYWIEGKVKGDYVMNVEVEFMVEGVSRHQHCAERFERETLDCDFTFDCLEGFPRSWTTDDDWTNVEVKKVELVREGEKPEGWEEAANGDLDLPWDELPEYEADYRVTIEFCGVRVPFVWEKWTGKLSCIDDYAGHEATDHTRETLRQLHAQLPSTARIREITWANVEARFSGVGEDGRSWPDVRIDAWAALEVK